MRYCYKKEELPEDIYKEFCFEMFRFRCKHKLTLDEVMVYTEIPVLELDRLECAMSDINFRVIAKLLKLYGEYLINFEDYFPGLKPEYKDCFITKPRETINLW